MRLIAINGSPRERGNTSILIGKLFEELNDVDIETREINVGSKHFRGCVACGGCWKNKNKKCIIKSDELNDIIEELLDADAIVLGSPVYCADVSGQMKTFIDRVSMVTCANDDMLKRKLGASITAVRRAGSLPALNTMNSFFTILQMPIISSSYWNMGFGYEEGDVLKDAEGIQTMKTLGKNLSYFLRLIEAGKNQVKEPDTITETLTNFIREDL